MKRYYSLAVALLAAVSLPACSQEEPVPAPSPETVSDTLFNEDITLSLWTYPVGNWGNPTALSSLLTEFRKAYPQIHISVKCLDYTTGDDKIYEALKNGTAPDLVFESSERLVAAWGEKGLMVDLSDLWESKYTEQVYPFVRSACQHNDGSYYILPICMSAHCMAINYDLFQEADALRYIDEDSRTWSTEDFIHAVETLHAFGQERVGTVYCGGQGGDQGTRALVNNLYGGSFTDNTHTHYTVDSEENIRALELLSNLEGISFDLSLVGSDEVDLFCRGELAMAFCWNGTLEVAQTIQNPYLNFDIFPMAFPTDSGQPKLSGGIWGLGIFDNKDEAKIEAAKTFIRFMTENNEQYTKCVLTSNFWPVREMQDIYDNDKLMSEYSIFIPYMTDYYQNTPYWAEARTAWWKMLQKISQGADIRTAVKEFSTTVP